MPLDPLEQCLASIPIAVIYKSIPNPSSKPSALRMEGIWAWTVRFEFFRLVGYPSHTFQLHVTVPTHQMIRLIHFNDLLDHQTLDFPSLLIRTNQEFDDMDISRHFQSHIINTGNISSYNVNVDTRLHTGFVGNWVPFPWRMEKFRTAPWRSPKHLNQEVSVLRHWELPFGPTYSSRRCKPYMFWKQPKDIHLWRRLYHFLAKYMAYGYPPFFW